MNFISRSMVSAISWYCTHSPLEPGKSRLQHLGLRLIGTPTVEATSRDGRRFLLEFPQDLGFDHICFRNTYETGTLEVLRRIVGADDVILDVGANMGWYSVHLAGFAPNGHIYAFEPMPPTFDRLEHNLRLNGVQTKVTTRQVALGENAGEVQLHSFSGLGHGHNSLSTLGRSDFTPWNVEMITLDSYIIEQGIDQVDLVKMDVEGAEMGVLSGARSIFAMERPPIWIIEMNNETAASFGHKPPDLLREIARHGTQESPYSFYRIVRSWDGLEKMSGVDDYQHGDNAVCVPHERLSLWKTRMGL